MRNRTFLRYLVSYALVLILPFLSVYLIFDNAMVRRYSEERTDSDSRMLSDLRDTLDGDLQQMFNLSYVIQNTSSLNPKNIGEDVIARRNAIALLGTYSSILTLPDTVIVYRSGDNYCYTGTTSITPQKLLGEQLVYEEHSLDDFFMAVDESSSLIVWPKDSVHQFGGQSLDVLTLFLSVGAGNVKPKQRTVFVIPARRLEDRIRSVAGGETSVLVSDRDGRLLMSTGTAPAEEALLRTADEASDRTIRLAGTEYLILKTASGITGWYYTVLRPAELMEEPLRSYRRWTALLLGFMLVLGGVLIYVMSWGSYRPIRRLAEKARSFAPEQDTGGDMEQVEAVLESLSDRSNTYRAMLESSTDGLRHNCIRQLLASADRADELLSELRGYGSLTDPDAPCRILVMEKKELQYPIQSIPEMLMSLSLEVTDTLVCDNPPDSDLIAVVFQYSGTAEGSNEEILQFQARLEKESGARVSMGVSESVPAAALAEAYNQAVSAWRMRLIRGRGSVVFFTPADQAAASYREYPLQQLDALQWYLLQMDTENVRRCLREIAAKLQKEPVSLELARMVCYDTINVTVRTLMSRERLSTDISPDRLESLMSFDSVQELTDRLEDFVEQACLSARNSDENGTDQRIEAMKQYIRENCFNDDFSLQMAADHFGLTPSNLSHYFKNCTGTGLSEYVQDLRRKEACRLLTETDEPIQEIGRRVGMPNGSSFIRSFKQQTGLTPGQYRAGRNRKRELS